MSLKPVGTEEITMLHSFLVVLTISQRKRHYKVCKSTNMHFKLYLVSTKADTQFFDNFHRFSKQSFSSNPKMNSNRCSSNKSEKEH